MPDYRISVEMEVSAASEQEAQAIVAGALAARLEIAQHSVTFAAVQDLSAQEYDDA